MSGQDILSREVALRIGLAARALPDTDAKRLFKVLTDCVSLPITENKLDSINLKSFKTALYGDFLKTDDVFLRNALHLLKHSTKTVFTQKPDIRDYTEGEMLKSVRIACASNDAITIDGHFGSCTQFLIYQVSAIENRLIDIRTTDIPHGLEVDDKNKYRAELIKDCQVIYVASVGGPAAAKIVKLGIHPMKLASIETIATVIDQLQTVISGTPPPWLAKVMGIEASDRFRFGRGATG